MLRHDGVLRRRLRALELRVEPLDEEDGALPERIALPPLTLPKEEHPNEEQVSEGMPRGADYTLYVLPALGPEPDVCGPMPESKTRTFLRYAFRRYDR
jgi:hypothetical protein